MLAIFSMLRTKRTTLLLLAICLYEWMDGVLSGVGGGGWSRLSSDGRTAKIADHANPKCSVLSALRITFECSLSSDKNNGNAANSSKGKVNRCDLCDSDTSALN